MSILVFLNLPLHTVWGCIILYFDFHFSSVQLLSCVRLFATPWTAACQPSLSITNSQGFLKLMSIKLVMPSNHLILFHPPLLLSSIFPSIRVFSNESVLHIRWSKYWSFSISLSDEYSGLISFRIDWFDLLAFQELLIVLSTFSYALGLFVYLLWRASSFLRKRAASHSLIF